MKTDYTYAAARIHTKESSLLSQNDIEMLLNAPDCEAALGMLAEMGWGNPEEPLTAEHVLAAETAATWDLVNELEQDPEALAVLKLTKDYHNLKAAIKKVCTGSPLPKDRLFEDGGRVDADLILKAVEEKDYSLLPQEMAAAAEAAAKAMVSTGDGQLCDRMIDKACLTALYEAGLRSSEEVLKEYAVTTVVSADIRIALRAARSKKPLSFLLDSLAPCEELDVQELAQAAFEGTDAVAEYLSHTDYAFLVPALSKSTAAFESGCDNMLIEHMKPQKYNIGTLGPLAAYVLARENEIKCVRMILTGKQNHLPEELLRESMREMYV